MESTPHPGAWKWGAAPLWAKALVTVCVRGSIWDPPPDKSGGGEENSPFSTGWERPRGSAASCRPPGGRQAVGWSMLAAVLPGLTLRPSQVDTASRTG